MKNSSDSIRNRTRDLPACSAVPQSTAPLRAHFWVCRPEYPLHRDLWTRQGRGKSAPLLGTEPRHVASECGAAEASLLWLNCWHAWARRALRMACRVLQTHPSRIVVLSDTHVCYVTQPKESSPEVNSLCLGVQ
jgi:hypothetical protein